MNFGIVLLVIGVILYIIGNIADAGILYVVASFVIVFRLVRDVVANHKTTRYAGAATKVIQKNHLA